jgi:glycosyltransferase involved in cell wall biosynthesis
MRSVDVVVPNYQYGRYLRDCVASILSQGIDRLRVLIIDNASTDDSVEVAQELVRCSDQIELRVHATNLGFHASINEGLDWAASDYLMVLCADDLLPPGALQRAVSVLEENPGTAYAYGAYARMTGSVVSAPLEEAPQATWRIESGDHFIARCCQDMVHAMAPLVRTSMQKKIGYYRTELRQTSDLEILLRLACCGDVAATSAIQGVQRIHQANLSARSWHDPTLAIINELELFDSFFSHEGQGLPHAERVHRGARRNAAARAYWRGMACILRGQHRTGRDFLKLAFSLTPRAIILPPVDYLLRTERPVHRIARVVSQAGASRRSNAASVGPPNDARY